MIKYSSYFISLLICFGLEMTLAASNNACDPSLSKVIFNENYNSIDATYLYITSPYKVEITAGGPFAAWINGTDLVTADVLMCDTNVTLNFRIDNVDVGNTPNTINTPTTSAPIGRTVGPAPTRVSSASKVTSFFAIGLGAVSGVLLFSKKGILPLTIFVVLLSVISVTETRLSGDIPCDSAQLTVQVPRYKVQFICINDLECICGPGYEGSECLIGGSPVADPPVNAPIDLTPVTSPVAPPVAAPLAAPISAPVDTPINPPVAETQCTNSVKDLGETDVDCGGPLCPPCNNGKICLLDSDCGSSYCTGFKCYPDSCQDGELNNDETSTDCGGSCPKCPTGVNCKINSDCLTNYCNKFCLIPDTLGGCTLFSNQCAPEP